MGDFVDEKYEKIGYDIEELSSHLLGYAKDFGVDKKDIEIFERKPHLSDRHTEEITRDILQYVDLG